MTLTPPKENICYLYWSTFDKALYQSTIYANKLIKAFLFLTHRMRKREKYISYNDLYKQETNWNHYHNVARNVSYNALKNRHFLSVSWLRDKTNANVSFSMNGEYFSNPLHDHENASISCSSSSGFWKLSLKSRASMRYAGTRLSRIRAIWSNDLPLVSGTRMKTNRPTAATTIRKGIKVKDPREPACIASRVSGQKWKYKYLNWNLWVGEGVTFCESIL